MQVDYAPFIDRVIQRYEGGYGWSKADPGGPTKYGITCYDLAEHRGQKMTSMTAWAPLVQAMPLSEAEAIYATKYATGVRFNDLPAGPDCCMCDYGINSGVSRPIAVARSLLKVTAPGMSDELVAAIKASNPASFCDEMNAERLRFMHAIRGGSAWAEYGHGWGARVADLGTYCNHLDSGGSPHTAPPAPDLSNVVTPKATHVPKTAGTPTVGGAAGAVVAAKVAGAGWITAGVVGAAIIAGGLAYEFWEEHKANAANALVHA